MEDVNKNSSYNSSLQSELKNLIESKKLSINKIAKSINYSPSALSTYLSNKYLGNVTNLEKAISSFLIRQKEIAEVPREIIPFVETENAKKIFEVCKMCHNENEIGIICGDAGTGKTKTIKEYAKQNSDVILIEADLSYTTKIFFRELHLKLGMDGIGGIHDMFVDCVNKLKDSNRLIIIDEAENLPYRSLDMIRRIYDLAGIGILLVGLPRLYYNLRGKRGEFKQLYSRIGVQITIINFNEDDVKNIIKNVFENSNGVYKSFYEISNGNGRVLEKLILRSSRLARINKKEVNEHIVKLASKMLVR